MTHGRARRPGDSGRARQLSENKRPAQCTMRQLYAPAR